jgi:hypothetical protein
MGKPTLQDFLSALSAVRCASDDVRLKGWMVAHELNSTIQVQLPILQHSFELPANLEQQRSTISLLCETWLRIFAHAKTYPHSTEQRTFGIDRAAKLADHIDALLAEIGLLNLKEY